MDDKIAILNELCRGGRSGSTPRGGVFGVFGRWCLHTGMQIGLSGWRSRPARGGRARKVIMLE